MFSRKLEITREHFMQRWANKDRNGMNLTEAKDIKNKWQEYMKNYTKKIFTTQVIMMVEPDILECKIKWVLGSITTNKASGGDGFPIDLFQILKDDPVKVLHSICQQIWKTQQWPWDWKRSLFVPSLRKAMPKNALTTVQFHSSYTLAK